MTVGLEFGVDQTVAHLDLKPASIRRDQGQVLELVFEFLEQVICQAHGPVGVVSYSAVDDFDVYHLGLLSKTFSVSGATVARDDRRAVPGGEGRVSN